MSVDRRLTIYAWANTNENTFRPSRGSRGPRDADASGVASL